MNSNRLWRRGRGVPALLDLGISGTAQARQATRGNSRRAFSLPARRAPQNVINLMMR
jgi:hypothetical protein